MKDTSLRAYLSIYADGKAESLRYRVYDFIFNNPDTTRQKIADATGIPINVVTPSVKELLDKRLIAENGKDDNHYKLRAVTLFERSVATYEDFILQKVKQAREDKDEKHICPLQLDVIERCVELWSNPKDLVFSPFAGIGSEGYQSIKMGRKFVGSELKESYFNVAVKYIKEILAEQNHLFSEV
jgi:DNA modification methylase